MDIDLVVEATSALGTAVAPGEPDQSSPACRLVEHLRLSLAERGFQILQARPHDQYGTVEVEVEQHAQPPGHQAAASAPLRLLLDVASARRETYPVPAENPVVTYGALEDDLARRDFTINAMAFDLAAGTLLDPYGGQVDLERRCLRFLHPASIRDDPTRLVRAARYAARLGFHLAEESKTQALRIIASWPWSWRTGESAARAPAALGTRLCRELELLLERENWKVALACLQEWGGLLLLDPLLQADSHWARRLHWATRLRVPSLLALIALAKDPLALAERLQLPHRQQRMLRQFGELCLRLPDEATGTPLPSTPCEWCQLLEEPGLSPEAVALALACGLGPRRPLLRWYLRWRHLGPNVTAHQLMASGVPKGPQLGQELRRSRRMRLEQERR